MAEHMIDIAEMAKSAVRSAVMEEVKNLGIRAAVKDSINEIGQLDKDEIHLMVEDTIDSYVRSANIEERIKKVVETTVQDRVDRAITKALNEYVEGSIFNKSPTSHLRQIVLNDLERQYRENYNLVVVNTKK